MSDDRLKLDSSPSPEKPAADSTTSAPESTPAQPTAQPEAQAPAQPEAPADTGLKIAGSNLGGGAGEIPHAGAPAGASSSDEDGEEEGSKKTFWIIVAVLFILILAMGGLTIYSNQTGQSVMDLIRPGTENEESQTEEEEGTETPDTEETEGTGETDETTETEESSSMMAYTGTHVSAELPEGWQIVEYSDGEGSDMLTEGVTYVGLTGLKVLAPEDKTVFAMEAVFGIGGVEACQDYYEFSDSSSQYYNDVVASSQANGVTPNVITIADNTYTELTFLGVSMRRAGQNLYWDKTSTGTTFDAACGIDGTIIDVDAPTYTADGDTLGNYHYMIETTATTAELSQLDTILESVTAN